MRQADAALYRAMWELAMDDVMEVSHRNVRVRVGANTDAKGIAHAARPGHHALAAGTM